MSHAWLSLVPPFITLAAALITKRIGPSLVLGITISALIYFKFSIKHAFLFSTARIWANSQLGDLLTWSGNFSTLYTFAFLFIIGIIVVLINTTGGAQAYAEKVSGYISDKRSVETSSILLSLSLFLDDYLNCLTMGCAMKPLTDKAGIARAKLAYLIDSMAAPWIIIVPFSSWVAVICKILQSANISETTQNAIIIANPYYVYLCLIPYVFYSFITIALVLIIVRNRLSFGPMYTHEKIAQETGNLLGGKHTPNTKLTMCNIQKTPSILEFLLPIGSLLLFCIFGLLYSGGFVFFGGTHGLFKAIQEANAYIVMFWSSVASLIIGITFSLARSNLSLSSLLTIIPKGLHLMLYPNLILLFAWTFSDLLTNYLHTGEYLAYLISNSISFKLLPVILYILTSLISISLGSAWSTMMIITPLAVPIVVAYTAITPPVSLASVPMLLPTLGAILSGAATGDHISPVASTTIMAATSSGSIVIDHVKTQFMYALPAIGATTVAFLVVGLAIDLHPLIDYILALGSGFGTLGILLVILNKLKK